MKTYQEKLEAFRALVEKQTNAKTTRLYPNAPLEKFYVEQGYKFDKVFSSTNPPVAGIFAQKHGRYMVESRTGNIYGIKSWTQVNRRRLFGTIDTIDQYDWSDYQGRAIDGTQAEKDYILREKQIRTTHKKRGRRPNASKLSNPTKKVGK